MNSSEDSEDYWNTSAKAFSFDEVDDAIPSISNSKRHLFAEDNISEISADETVLAADEFILSQYMCDEDLKMLIDEQSIDEEPLRKGISTDTELRILRRKLQDTMHPPTVEITSTKLLMGKRCSLEPYKSLQDKVAILDEVILSGNGSGILGIVLFLERTLNRKQFHRILMKRPEACNQYLNFQETKMKINEATELLIKMGREKDAAFLNFKVAMKNNSDPKVQQQKLIKIYNDFFVQRNSSKFCTDLIKSAINLIEWQEKYKSLFNVDDLVGSTPLESLYYSCVNHKWKTSNANEPTNPYKFISDYKISPSLFEWVALNERAKAKSYIDLEEIFEKSSWHSLKQKQFNIHIPLDVAILRLNQLQAPSPVLHLFLSRISDSKERLVLARQVKCVRSVIDALAALKEKNELEEFRNVLPEGSEEWFHAENTLKNFNKRWSTDNLKIIKK